MLLKRLLLVALLALPLTAWAFIKPVRILAPELVGMTCHNSVCVDDGSRLAEAAQLYEPALLHVGLSLSPLKTRPLIIFCSTVSCYESFGGGAERAITFPRLGSIISPTSWAAHFVRHEIIHALQAQELGTIRMMRGPAWFREGMAYSLSDPPPCDMPQQFMMYRAQYEAWAAANGGSKLWLTARSL